jgi:hypothetical protein
MPGGVPLGNHTAIPMGIMGVIVLVMDTVPIRMVAVQAMGMGVMATDMVRVMGMVILTNSKRQLLQPFQS